MAAVKTARRRATSLDKRWRPNDRTGPTCYFTWDGKTCTKSGAHYCEPRADVVVGFFADLLVHTKGDWARQAFVLDDWQEQEIIRPLFGEVEFSPEWGRYVRRYRIAYVIVARKNGKSELAAGIALYLLAGDGEEGSEVYGAAKHSRQATKVWEPARRMRDLSPLLRDTIGINKHTRRLFVEETGSHYEIITADALGELGHNPHGFILDEFLTQPDDRLYNTMRTASGTRAQPLMLLISTETDDEYSFGARMIDEAERVQDDPKRAPHVFAFVRKLDHKADAFDERNWKKPNPALGSFLSVKSLREEALEAKNDPSAEKSFRQFRCNQRQHETSGWIPLSMWDASSKIVWPRPDYALPALEGRKCYAGLDLSSIEDLTAWALLFPPEREDEKWMAWWRYFVPEEMIPELDKHTAGKASVWKRQGWLQATEGNVIDYDAVYEAIAEDTNRFKIVDVSADRWNLEAVRQEIEKRTRVSVYPLPQTYQGVSPAMKQLHALVKAGELEHGHNPISRWNVESTRIRQDPAENIKPVKPDRRQSGARIDGVVALVMAVDAAIVRKRERRTGMAGF